VALKKMTSIALEFQFIVSS